MKVLLTGASGFVGSYVLRRLLDESHEVAVVIRQPQHAWRVTDLLGRVQCITADLARLSDAESEIKHFAPEAVAHLAWHGVGNRLRNDRTQLVNVDQSRALFDLALSAGAKTFVGLGSQAEYGPAPGMLDEQAPTQPTTLYGISKLSTFHYLQFFAREAGVRFAWLRLFSSYGPMDDPAWMIPYLILRLLQGERPALTAGEQLWDYIHVDDAAAAIVRVLQEPRAIGIFNLGSGQVTPIRKIAELIRDFIDPKLPMGFGEVPYRPDQVMHLQANITRLEQLADWQPRIELSDGLRRTVEWFREHRQRHIQP